MKDVKRGISTLGLTVFSVLLFAPLVGASTCQSETGCPDCCTIVRPREQYDGCCTKGMQSNAYCMCLDGPGYCSAGGGTCYYTGSGGGGPRPYGPTSTSADREQGRTAEPQDAKQ